MITILTSNRTRELHDALRRRCLYHWIDYPDRARERAIIERARARHRSAKRPNGWSRRWPASASCRLSSGRASPRASTGRAAPRVLHRDGAAWPEALKRSLGLMVKDQEDFAVIEEAALL